MTTRKAKKGEKIFNLKVLLPLFDENDRVLTKSSPYRIVAVPSKMNLYDLAEYITEIFEFDFDRPFGFYDNVNNWNYSTQGYEVKFDGDEYESDWPDVESALVEEIFKEKGKKWLFIFDFEEENHFYLNLEKSEKPDDTKMYPLLLDSYGKLPSASSKSEPFFMQDFGKGNTEEPEEEEADFDIENMKDFDFSDDYNENEFDDFDDPEMDDKY